MGLAIDVSKVKLHFRVNLWPSFWGPKTLAKPVSPRRASPVPCRDGRQFGAAVVAGAQCGMLLAGVADFGG